MEPGLQREFELEQNVRNYRLSLMPWWSQLLSSAVPTFFFCGLIAIGIYSRAAIPVIIGAIFLSVVAFKIRGRRLQILPKKWFRFEVLDFPFRLTVSSTGIEIRDNNGKEVNSISKEEIEAVRFEAEFVCVDYLRIDIGMPETLELCVGQFPNENWEAVKTAFGPDVLGNFEGDA